MKNRILAVGVAAACAAAAGTVSFNPGNGVEQNVTERLTGATDVVANAGASGGGIVTLAPYNDYTGITSNGCGTLVARGLAERGAPSSIGSTGDLYLGAGTFRYAGPAGAVLGHDVVNAFGDGETNRAVVIDATRDFAFEGVWTQSAGAVIKRGVGTFTILGGPEGTTNYFGVAGVTRLMGLTDKSVGAELSFPSNGDAPTTGYAGLTIAEGTLRIAGGVNVFGQNWGTRVGAKCDYAAEPMLEITGGTSYFYNGFMSGCTKSGGRAVVRITGGEVIHDQDAGDDKKLVGIGAVKGSEGVLEMTGGTFTLKNGMANLSPGLTGGSIGTVDIRGGTMKLNRNVIFNYSGSSSSCADGSFTVSGSGVLDVSNGNIEIYNVNGVSTWNFAVTNGGTVYTQRFFRNGERTKPTWNFLVDGGLLRGTADYHFFGDGTIGGGVSPDGVCIGTRGLILEATKNRTLTLSVPLVATNTADGAAAGLTLRPVSGNATFVMTTNNAYAGPTVVQGNAFLKLTTGDLPPASDVTLDAGARLYVANHPRTFRTLSFTGKSSQWHASPNAPVTVTDTFRAAAGCAVALYANDSLNSAYATPGEVTLLTVPAADAEELRRFASGGFSNISLPYRAYVDVANGVAVLKVRVYGQDDPREIVLNDGDSLNLGAASLNLCTMSGQGFSLVATTGSVIHAAHISADKVDDASVSEFFDGGTFMPIFPSGENSYHRNVAQIVLGAGGITYDLSECCPDPATRKNYLNIKGVFLHDPRLGDASDGGITVTGGGALMFGGAFVCAFTGPVHVTGDARLSDAADGNGVPTMQNCRVFVDPGAFFEQGRLTTGRCVSLALGAEGAEEPTHLVLMSQTDRVGFAIADTCTVLSPVDVAFRTEEFPALSRVSPVGVVTALVYRAEGSSVDPALFSVAPGRPDLAATFETVPFASADYPDCDTALIVTCSSRPTTSATWIATTGGDWQSLPNWENVVAPPNGRDARTVFRPASAAAGTVTLPSEGVTLNGLTLDGAGGQNGYALTGGPLTLHSYAGTTPVLTATTGVHRVESLNVAASLSVKTGTNTAGIARLELGAVTDDSAITLNSAKTSGTVAFGDMSGYGGILTTGYGTAEFEDLSFATASTLKLGAGTLLYTGADASFDGFTTASITAVETDADLFAREPAATGGALIKRGAGTLTLGGTKTLTLSKGSGASSEAAMRIPANGNTPTSHYYGLTSAEGTLAIGVVDDPAHAPTVNCTSDRPVAIGTPQTRDNATLAAVQLNNGTLTGGNITMSFHLNQTGSKPLTVRYEQNGGVANCTYLRTGYNNGSRKTRYEVLVNGGVFNAASYITLNYSNPGGSAYVTNVFRVTGGTVNVGTNFFANSASTRNYPVFVTLDGGTLSVGGTFDFTSSANTPVRLDLNEGATFKAGRVMQSANNGTFVFNGGTFMPLGGVAGGETLTDLKSVLVGEKGAVVDTSEMAGGVFTIAQALRHDSTCAGADGGLVKAGAGTLVLTGANAYTGPTKVADGTLRPEAADVMSDRCEVDAGGILDLNGAAYALPWLVRAPGAVVNGTLSLTGGFVVTGDLEDAEACPVFTAGLTMGVDAVIDLELADDAEGPAFGTRIPLAFVGGEVHVPAQVKAAHAGAVRRFKLTFAGGLLTAEPMSGGTLIIFR